MTAGSILATGLIVFAGLLAVPAVSHTNAGTTFSLMASSMAFVAMAIAQFMATRPPVVERLFGGLDRIYHFHRKVGIAVLLLILVHYFLTPDFQGLALTSDLNKGAAAAGEWAFYGFVFLLVLSIVKVIPKTRIEIPYHYWRVTHRFIGLLFMLVAFHQMFIKRPYDGTALLATYLNVFAAVGIVSYLYTQLLPWIRTRRYDVTHVEKHGGATIITAKPAGRRLSAIPGQFGFFRVGKPGLREPHPFTIAGIDEDGTVRFAIKPLGDFTRALRDGVAVGDALTLEGGYGRFNHRRGGKKQIWLAGGIGVTPFLAMASRLKGDEGQDIHMVYCVRDKTEAIGVDTFRTQAEKLSNFSFTLHDSTTDGRLDAQKLVSAAPINPAEADLWFCGPPPLRLAIEKGLRELGKAPRRVEFERFEFR
ncbi:ferric reductase-like transmembrane domain-containing protein [Rhizobium sp. TRM95111]|uniref:ferredoxin reductase family protein n=1 Tax=Rhizobium alarense TaxID=2846851 RepID=UPI001F23224E|nr:ferric reductase-like transmembrane domain-containing protein [Rhizobium alarense]MCF3641117.1 ferric reductase-like transmembrane domain-containing protein [Rhizobium alarense]